MILAYSLLAGLAAYRAWRILALDTITEPFRDWLTSKESWVAEFVADLILCAWCLGFWWSCFAAWIIAELNGYSPAEFALVALAASTICGSIYKKVDA